MTASPTVADGRGAPPPARPDRVVRARVPPRPASDGRVAEASVRALAAELGVAKNTAHRAIATLVGAGLIEAEAPRPDGRFRRAATAPSTASTSRPRRPGPPRNRAQHHTRRRRPAHPPPRSLTDAQPPPRVPNPSARQTSARRRRRESTMLRVTTIHASGAHSARPATTPATSPTTARKARSSGSAAKPRAWDLAGAVSTEDLEALLSGRDPVTGTRLGTELVDRVDAKGRLIRAVGGFDATFSAPKSLSVWWGLTGDPGLLEAHDLAVRAVLDHIERYGSTTRVRVHGARQHPDTGGLTMAAFRQATSREDDPQLHSHVVISAKVQTADGRWMALDAGTSRASSELSAACTSRCFGPSSPTATASPGVRSSRARRRSSACPRSCSPRSPSAPPGRQAPGGQGRRVPGPGGSRPDPVERAALTREAAEDSRAAKTRTSTGALSSTLDRRSHDYGLDCRAGRRRHASRSTRQPRRGRAHAARRRGGRAALRSRLHLDPPGRLHAICDLAPPVSQLSGRRVGRAPSSASPTRSSTPASPSTRPATAPCARRTDARPGSHRASRTSPMNTSSPRKSASSPSPSRPRTGPSTIAHVDSEGLDVLQADAAAAVAGQDRLVLVVGPAGAGKTTALRRAGDDLRRQHRAVFGVTPTAKAAKVLRNETGIAADTIAKLLHEWRTGQPRDGYRLPAGATVVVDEAGMCGTGALDQLVQLAVSQQWRLVLVGDPRQLQAVGRGGMFDELCRSGRVHELATIHRFRQHWEQQASLQLRAANPDALDAYFHHRRVEAGAFDDLTRRHRPPLDRPHRRRQERRHRRRDQRTRRRPERRHPAGPPPARPPRPQGGPYRRR